MCSTNPFDIGSEIRKSKSHDVTAGEKSCNCGGFRPKGPWCLQPGHPGGGQEDLVCVWPAGPAGDKL